MPDIPNLTHAIKSLAQTKTIAPGSAEILFLPLADAIQLKTKLSASFLEIDRSCLQNGIWPERYLRNNSQLSLADQYRLSKSRVLIVGLGGLGGYVLELLARAGVGHIIGADGDSFEPSNLNRQILCAQNSITQVKAEAAANRATAVNPAIHFIPVSKYLSADDFDRLMPDIDIVVDALGGMDQRRKLLAAAAKANKTVVSAAVAGWCGWVGAIFAHKPSPFSQDLSSAVGAEETLGTPAPTVCLAASIQAGLTIRLLTGKNISKKFTFFDLSDHTFENMKIVLNC